MSETRKHSITSTTTTTYKKTTTSTSGTFSPDVRIERVEGPPQVMSTTYSISDQDGSVTPGSPQQVTVLSGVPGSSSVTTTTKEIKTMEAVQPTQICYMPQGIQPSSVTKVIQTSETTQPGTVTKIVETRTRSVSPQPQTTITKVTERVTEGTNMPKTVTKVTETVNEGGDPQSITKLMESIPNEPQTASTVTKIMESVVEGSQPSTTITKMNWDTQHSQVIQVPSQQAVLTQEYYHEPQPTVKKHVTETTKKVTKITSKTHGGEPILIVEPSDTEIRKTETITSTSGGDVTTDMIQETKTTENSVVPIKHEETPLALQGRSISL